MKRRRSVPLPGLPSVDGQIVQPSTRRWPVRPDPVAARQAYEAAAAARAAHFAELGEHTCTPDPTNPWSTCRLMEERSA